MNSPIAVLISDIHFTPNTLDLASQALLKAQFKAKMLDVPLIIAGDTMDTKAILRAECVNKFMRMLAVRDAPKTYLMVGNHDLCNEKGDDHALQFAFGLCEIIDSPKTIDLDGKEVMLIPYYSNTDKLQVLLKDEDIPETLIMHQGVQTAYLGHYTQDKTSLPPKAFANFRVISGHYHRRQDIITDLIPDGDRRDNIGLFSYIGNPYTQNFGEASDPEKGFQILYDDGSLEFVPTNLRKHIIVEHWVDGSLVLKGFPVASPTDLIWLKVHGLKSKLDAFNKQEYGKLVFGHDNYKLELIPTDNDPIPQSHTEGLTEAEVFDTVIDSTQEPKEIKAYLKVLWRETLENT